MNTLAAQLVYMLQRGEVEVVITICIFLEATSISETIDALIVGVNHELKFR